MKQHANKRERAARYAPIFEARQNEVNERLKKKLEAMEEAGGLST
jgi:hypothetical protein